jgi:ATP-dependent helicase/nuclease subunit A
MVELHAIPRETRFAQSAASDPARSAWVSANAGAGKTFVLARRVIRLLLDGVEPSRILCLTFTRAAAAEMSNRVFETLGRWVKLPDDELRQCVADILDRQPTQTELARAPVLFALALDTPGGLKIQTIHAYCEALLHQFPLEANMPCQFEVVEDNAQQMLVRSAADSVLQDLEAGQGGHQPLAVGLRAAFGELLQTVSDSAMNQGLNALIAVRHEFLEWTAGDIEKAMAPLWEALGLRPDQDEDSLIDAELGPTDEIDAVLLTACAVAVREGGVTNFRFADRLDAFRRASSARARFAALAELYLTKNGERRRTIVTKKVLQEVPGLDQHLDEKCVRFAMLRERLCGLRLLRESRALFLLGESVLGRYDALKKNRGLADFDDLIEASVRLLNRSNVRQWIQYKLDSSIDHVLIDEAQDTSPRQWQIINTIVEDFFAGDSTAHRKRTVFAVGDEKQSIYSFQGADPREFSRQANLLEKKSTAVDLSFTRVSLNLSFRAVPDVLGAVDAVFAIPDNYRGLTAPEVATIHQAVRAGDPGDVQIWPLFTQESRELPSSWLAPVDTVEQGDPAVRLAQRIAATIRDWLDRGEKLPGRDKPLRCGDILVLVRRRDKFSRAVIRELKSSGLAIAGADRLVLSEHIVVEDLLALARFALMPEDDLSLASVLKSPLFDFDEDILLAIAAGRGDISMFNAMKKIASKQGGELEARLAAAVKQLDRLCESAHTLRPFDFFGFVLGNGGGRRAFLARLGMEAEDVLDAFLQAAIEHERAGGLGLEDFLDAFAQSPVEVKREIDMRKDEIRVITVHAAKGLEAPVVFVVDPCAPAFSTSHRPTILKVEAKPGRPGFVFQSQSRLSVAMTDACLTTARQDADEEYRRLLYVAMTRAADRLIVCGWHGPRVPNHRHWHRMVHDALVANAESVPDRFGERFVWRVQDATLRARMREKELASAPTLARAERAVPAWLLKPAAPEQADYTRLSPSQAWRLHTLAPGGRPNAMANLGHDSTSRSGLETGLALHRLMQHLPDVLADERELFASDWMGRNMPHWSAELRKETLERLTAILDNAELAVLFAPESRAEVGLSGRIELNGSRFAVSGQVDRIGIGDGRIIVADYKSDFSAPAAAERAPRAYVLQLALYRNLLRAIYPGKSVFCLLVWLRTGTFCEIADLAMDRALRAMAKRAEPILDGG